MPTAAQSNDVFYVRKPSQRHSEEPEKSGETRGLSSNLIEMEAEKGKKKKNHPRLRRRQASRVREI